MSDTVKFTFDTEFGDLDEAERQLRLRPPVDPADEPKHSDNQLAAAREEAYAEGIETGVQQARQEGEYIASTALTTITQEMARLNGIHETIVRDAHKESINLALVIARKLAGELLARFSVPEVENVIRDLLVQLGDLTAQPKVVAGVNPDLAPIIEQHIEGLKAQSGFEGQVSVIGEDGISGSDCRVEWAEGGGQRDAAQIESEITGAVVRYIESLEVRWQREVERAAQDPAADGVPASLEAPPAQVSEPELVSAVEAAEESEPDAEDVDVPIAPDELAAPDEVAAPDELEMSETLSVSEDLAAPETAREEPSDGEAVPETGTTAAAPAFAETAGLNGSNVDLSMQEIVEEPASPIPNVEEVTTAEEPPAQDDSYWPAIEQSDASDESDLDTPTTVHEPVAPDAVPPEALPKEQKDDEA